MSERSTAPIDLGALRRDYEQSALYRRDLQADPIEQLSRWLQDAIELPTAEPTAMTLATVAEGRPRARVVLLKGLDRAGLRFFTNYDSQKGRELAAQPHAALCFFWPELQRQVRVEGSVSKVSRQESVDYFASRPYDSQISAAASPQSRVLDDRAALEGLFAATRQRFAGKDVEAPESWGGYLLAPSAFEFWQGRRNRLHDRFRYLPQDNAWRIERLAP